MWITSVALSLAFVTATLTNAAPLNARPQPVPAAQEFMGVAPDANCPTGLSAEPPGGGPRTCYVPGLQAALYVDATCPSGFLTYIVATGVRVCYTPDMASENSNLQDRCPEDPSLYVCPGED